MRGRAAVLLFIFLSAYPVLSQDLVSENEEKAAQTEERLRPGEFWLGLGGEAAMFGTSGFSYGGSFAFGYGVGVSVGLKAAYFFDNVENIDVLELNFLLRFYLRGLTFSSGPFVQVLAGSAVFFRRETGFAIPAQWGIPSAGACFGWRFNIGKVFFAEPYIRGGYPYIFGGGVAAGVRF
jgi:hypothetical protein